MATRRWVALSAVCAGVFLAAMDFYVVTIAVPDMLREFRGSGIAQVSWVFNGYTITYTAALLPAAGLADRLGRRRVFLAGLSVFTLSALACATAPGLAVLIAARLVQGLAGGTITPLALPLVTTRFPAAQRGRAIGLWTATQSAAVAAGPSVGGLLVSAIGWRAVFGLQLPIGLAAVAGVARAGAPRSGAPRAVQAAGEEPAGTAARQPDLLGVLLLLLAIALAALAIVQSQPWGVLGWRTGLALGAGLLLGAAFVRRSLNHPAPVIDLGLLRIRTVRRANAVMLLTGLVMFASPTAAVLFLTGVWRYTEARAGLALTPAPVAQAVAALAAGRLTGKLGARKIAIAGAALQTASMATLALAIGAHSRYWLVVFPAVLGAGAGIGFLIISLSAAALSEVPGAKLASVTSMTVIARAAGAIVSLAALALILASSAGGTGSLHAYRLTWTLMTAVAAVALAACCAVRE